MEDETAQAESPQGPDSVEPPNGQESSLRDFLQDSTVARREIGNIVPKVEDETARAESSKGPDAVVPAQGEDSGLRDSLRDSTVARLLMRGRLDQDPETPPMDLSSKPLRTSAENSPTPEVRIENVDPEGIACPVFSPEVPPEISAEMSTENSSKPQGRKRRRKQTLSSVEGGDLRCPYCPFQASNKTTMSSHFQFHQQILGSQSASSSRNSHLEWIQAYQAGHRTSGEALNLVNQSTTDSPNVVPDASSQVGSPTLRSLLVGGGAADDRANSASGFLRSIVQSMMGPTGAPAATAAAASARASPSSRLGSQDTPRKVSVATSTSSCPSSSSPMLASVLSGTAPVPIAEPVRIKTEPLDFDSDQVYIPNTVPTSTTETPPRTESNSAAALEQVKVKQEPHETSPLDPHDPDWTPDSHSGCSSPASGTGQPVTTNNAPSTRNSRKGCPKKRILGSFLQRRENELGIRNQNQNQNQASSSNVMLSLLQGHLQRPVQPAGRGKRGPSNVTLGHSRTAYPQSTVPQQPDSAANQGLRVIYVDKNDGKTFVDKYVQCQLLNDTPNETKTKVFRENVGLEDSRLSLVVGEAQEGQMGAHLHSTKCPHCNITFDDEVLHSIHMGCHSHRDPFICNVCGKHCSHKYEFYTHIVRGHQVNDNNA